MLLLTPQGSGAHDTHTQYKLYGTEVLNLFVRVTPDDGGPRHAPFRVLIEKTQKLKYNEM